jgi:hypothetical protein
MFADDDLSDACKAHGELIHSALKFQHNHFTNGRALMDDTYKRHNNQESWEIGKKVYEKRKAKGFV